MRKLQAWGLAVMVSAGLASVAIAEDDPDKKPAPSWWGRLFTRPQPKEELTQLIDAQELKAQRNLEAVKTRQEQIRVDGQSARERYLRREMVLDRIQELAVASGDTELSKRIEGLRERAFAVSQKQFAPPVKTAERAKEGKP